MKEQKTLEQVANEYVTQDNRSTRFPYALLITEELSSPVEDWSSAYDFLIVKTSDEEYRFNTYNDPKILALAEVVNDTGGMHESFDSISDPEDMIEFFQNYIDIDCELVRMVSRSVFTGVQMFLTESSANEYIDKNKHNMNEPSTYGIHVYDDLAMISLIHELMKKASLPIEQWNQEARRYFIQEVLKVKNYE